MLGAAFLIAGAAKLADRRPFMRALGEFGVPASLQPFGVMLPPLELAVAAGLVFASATRYAAWGALALLTGFMVGIVANLIRGRQPTCHCFGQLRAKPIGWQTVARNSVLAIGAIWLVVSPQPDPAADLWVFLSHLSDHGRRIATVVAAALGFALLHAMRGEKRIRPASVEEPGSAVPEVQTPTGQWSGAEAMPSRPAGPERLLTGLGLPIGTPAPGFVLPDLEGQPHSLESFRASDQPVVLVFSSPFCPPCQRLTPRLRELSAGHDPARRVVVVSRGSVQQHAGVPGRLDSPIVLLQRDNEVAEAYDCTSTPAAVIVGVNGVIESKLAVGTTAVEQLISS
jgi:peroxiredoxin